MKYRIMGAIFNIAIIILIIYGLFRFELYDTEVHEGLHSTINIYGGCTSSRTHMDLSGGYYECLDTDMRPISDADKLDIINEIVSYNFANLRLYLLILLTIFLIMLYIFRFSSILD